MDGLEPGQSQRDAFRRDVLHGLSARQKTLPSRWLYDDLGSELFERITRLEEYYPTRTETAILAENADEIAAFLGSGATLIEYGAGAGIKTELVLSALDKPRGYVPVDIAGDFLEISADRLRGEYPDLAIRPVVADFTTDFDLPSDLPRERRSAFFPGSTLGNLDEEEAADFLVRVGRHVGADGRLVMGIDLVKDIGILLRAYDDDDGTTAAFDLNILTRINRELGATFDPTRFRHEARWNAAASAVESHLVCDEAHAVSIGDEAFEFTENETIHTETSRKYDLREFTAFAGRCGWAVEKTWQDDAAYFAVVALVRR